MEPRASRAQYKRLRFRLSSALLLTLLHLASLTSCSAKETPLPTATLAANANLRQLTIFDELDQIIQDEFLYDDFGGVNWSLLTSQVRGQIQQGMDDEAFYSALKELVATLPEGMATFSTREERISADLEETNLYEGIGAFVTYRADPEPHIVILSVIEGSPAEAAGLLAHDSVYAIDGTPIDPSEGIDAVSRIRGPGGSEVTLEIASPGEDHRNVDVLRQQVIARRNHHGRDGRRPSNT
jgi:carboxyl-terminal processing protease